MNVKRSQKTVEIPSYEQCERKKLYTFSVFQRFYYPFVTGRAVLPSELEAVLSTEIETVNWKFGVRKAPSYNG
jgi:hypothetical protein